MAAKTTDSSADDSGMISEINVTPFVDVVLVLLVIFMITAPTLMKDTLGIQLPKAASSDSKTGETLGIAITREGQILINGQLATPEVLAEQVKDSLKKNPEIQAVIAADTDTRHGDVVRVVDLLKINGLNRFALQIQRD